MKNMYNSLTCFCVFETATKSELDSLKIMQHQDAVQSKPKGLYFGYLLCLLLLIQQYSTLLRNFSVFI